MIAAMIKTLRIFASLLAAAALALPSFRAAALPDIYPSPDRAPVDLSMALQSAASTHRRVIVDFGGNWCTDCHVLDMYFHDAVNRPILDQGFVLVHVNVGRMDRNVDLAARFQVPLKKGVPALAVLDGDGKLLYSQSNGEFEAMRRMNSSSVTEFLTQWQPKTAR